MKAAKAVVDFLPRGAAWTGEVVLEIAVLPVARAVMIGDPRTLLALALGCTGGIVLARTGGRLRGSTLVAPWAWSCFSLAALAGVEAIAAFWGAEMPARAAVHLRYWAAITTLSPFVALLGAKRPQDRAWQWIVFSLMVLLALPSLKAMLLDAAAAPAPHAAWRWLLATIALAGLLNFLPTRYGVAASLFCGAQLLTLADYLPGFASPFSGHEPLLGLALTIAALLAAQVAASAKKSPAESVDRLWLDFRDAFGALWALRVAERFNASAVQQGWNVRLAWRGLEIGREGPRSDHDAVAASPDFIPAMHQNLKSLLWRFVAPEWIAERLG
jgi:hypothetical protein